MKRCIPLLALLIPTLGHAVCFEEAAARYRVPSLLLQAISTIESGGNPAALNKNKNGSVDIGHMQINTVWLPVLSRYGISRENLSDPCLNTHVGAWILAKQIAKHGYNWDAVGYYHSSTPDKRLGYSMKIAQEFYSNRAVR